MSRAEIKLRDPKEEERLRQPRVLPGERVRYWRGVRGWSIRTLAKHAGASKSAIEGLETGDTKHSRGVLMAKLAKALNISIEYLATGEEEAEQSAQALLSSVPWPFAHIPPSRIASLHKSERKLFEYEVERLLQEIEADRESPVTEQRRSPRAS